jgi:hypothetical protein
MVQLGVELGIEHVACYVMPALHIPPESAWLNCAILPWALYNGNLQQRMKYAEETQANE